MSKVKIVTQSLKTDYEPRERDVIYVDGVEVARGNYGGEPEDNSRGRDYNWVGSSIASVAKALGAEVETEFVELEDDEYYG